MTCEISNYRELEMLQVEIDDLIRPANAMAARPSYGKFIVGSFCVVPDTDPRAVDDASRTTLEDGIVRSHCDLAMTRNWLLHVPKQLQGKHYGIWTSIDREHRLVWVAWAIPDETPEKED